MNARREPSGRAEGATPKIPLARRRCPGKRLDGPPHEFGHRNALAFRSLSKRFGLRFRQPNLRADHLTTMTEVIG